MNLKQEQTEILNLLYKFRYLNRKQIQLLLGQKHFQRLILRLNELAENGYIYRYYSRQSVTQISVYSLDKKSRLYLLEQENINPELLKRVYWEKNNSLQFRKHCLFLADIYLSLRSFSQSNNLNLTYYTETDLTGMSYLVNPPPDGFIALEESNKNVSRYFVEVFDEFTQWKDYIKRVGQYISYCHKGYWQRETKELFPDVIFVCPNYRMQKSMNTYIGKVTKNKNSDISFYLTTWNDIQIKGLVPDVLHAIQ